MEKLDIKKLYDNVNDYISGTVTVGGWVKSSRDLKTFAFIDLTDGTCFKSLQVVVNANLINYDVVSKLNTGSSVLIKGKIVLTPNNKQPFELQASLVEVLSETDAEYPLQKKRHSVEFLREIAYLRPRTNLFNSVFRVRSKAAYAIHKFFNENGFVYVHTPIITGADCEGGSDVFRVTTHKVYDKKSLENATSSYQLETGYLNAKESKTYNLRIWLGEETPLDPAYMNKTLNTKITVVTSYLKEIDTEIPVANFTTSKKSV